MLLVLLIVTRALGAPTATELEAIWAEHASLIGQKSGADITLSAAEFRTIAKGEIAKRRTRQDGPDTAIGIGWTAESKDKVWVSIIDDIHNTMVSSLSEERLGLSKTGGKLLYQHLKLPWPFQNRHWVIEIRNNVEMATASQGKVWERVWALSDQRAATPADAAALWVPMIDGAWLTIDAAGGTLVVYRARTTIGGVVPDEVVTRWALSTLDEMLENLFERAGEISAHYGRDHAPIRGGDDINIEQFKAE